jgi:hypothetical protein
MYAQAYAKLYFAAIKSGSSLVNRDRAGRLGFVSTTISFTDAPSSNGFRYCPVTPGS